MTFSYNSKTVAARISNSETEPILLRIPRVLKITTARTVKIQLTIKFSLVIYTVTLLFNSLVDKIILSISS